MELVDPSEAAGLAGATEEAVGLNGAPVLLPVLPDVLPQHLVLLRRPRPLLHPRHWQQPRPSSWTAPSSQRPVLSLVRRFRGVWPSGRGLGNGFVAAVGLGS
jgi:hypothetical protein